MFKLFVWLSVIGGAFTVLTQTIRGDLHHDRPRDAAPHQYRAPGEFDSRSPCPALNVLANHGYINRNGRDVSPFDLISALQEVYGLDNTIAHLLSLGGFFLVNQRRMSELPTPPSFQDPLKVIHGVLTGFNDVLSPQNVQTTVDRATKLVKNVVDHPVMDLQYIGLHNHIEHDASITHDDAHSADADFAPTFTNHSLYRTFLDEAVAGGTGQHVDLYDLGTSRERRERESIVWHGRAIDALHAEIARGEAALVIGIFGETLPTAPADVVHTGKVWSWDGLGVHKNVMDAFWLNERLPAGWRPVRVTSIKSTHAGNQRVGDKMKAIRLAQNATASFVDTAQHVLSH